MLRVPGRATDLLSVKARGGDVRIVYSPLDAVELARSESRRSRWCSSPWASRPPRRPTPWRCSRPRGSGSTNFSVLVSHVLVPPAMEAILSSPASRVQGFLAAGHVCTVMGYAEYEPLVARYRVPIVVTGFEPLDILQGVFMCVKQLEEGRAEVENQYTRAVRREGNVPAQRLIREVFQVVPRKWRGVGEIPQSGLGLADAYRAFDAETRFGVADQSTDEPTECQSGRIMQGLIKPPDCAAFGTTCTPEHPLGATMVSSEGACAAYYRYRRLDSRAPAWRSGMSESTQFCHL